MPAQEVKIADPAGPLLDSILSKKSVAVESHKERYRKQMKALARQ